MLDDVERRTFLIDPARKHSLPTAIGLLDIELEEGAGQPLIFPRRAGFASAQADDRVAHADCLPRPQREVADDAVALVHQCDHRDPLGHRRYAPCRLDRLRHVDRHRGAVVALVGRRSLPIAAAEHQQRAKRDCDRDQPGAHPQSGVHA